MVYCRLLRNAGRRVSHTLHDISLPSFISVHALQFHLSSLGEYDNPRVTEKEADAAGV